MNKAMIIVTSSALLLHTSQRHFLVSIWEEEALELSVPPHDTVLEAP
jgi:hypothetical protein